MAERGTTHGRRCAHCGDVLGVYEPIVVVRGDQPPLSTSLANLGDVGAEQAVLHAHCLELREADLAD
jgi:hypothetical protein